MASTDDYLNLITEEYADKPRFTAMIKALSQGFVDIQNIEAVIPNFYDIDVAVGVQLDAIGVWIGISRYLKTPLTNVYFTWDDTTLVGWDSGSWMGPYDSATGITVLSDDAYRTLLKAKSAANQWDGTIPLAVTIWNTVFGTGQTVIIQDNQDMSMIMGFVGPPLTAVQQALVTSGYIPLKPEGVHIAFYAIPIDTNPIFAWDATTTLLNGWNVASWAQQL